MENKKIANFSDGACPECGGHSFSQYLDEPMRCSECGWVEEQSDTEKREAFFSMILDEMERIESVVKGVCPHAQYCGNGTRNYYGNSKPHKFICRDNMLKHNRHDGLIMVEPFTNDELAEAFKAYCWRHHGEFCETATQWRPNLENAKVE